MLSKPPGNDPVLVAVIRPGMEHNKTEIRCVYIREWSILLSPAQFYELSMTLRASMQLSVSDLPLDL